MGLIYNYILGYDTDDNTWLFDVLNINDINFVFKPIDLLEVGIDKVFKKAIAINPENYYLRDRAYLKDIDFNNFNYILKK